MIIKDQKQVENLIKYNVGLAINTLFDSWQKEVVYDIVKSMPEVTLRTFRAYLLEAHQAKIGLTESGFFQKGTPNANINFRRS